MVLLFVRLICLFFLGFCKWVCNRTQYVFTLKSLNNFFYISLLYYSFMSFHNIVKSFLQRNGDVLRCKLGLVFCNICSHESAESYQLSLHFGTVHWANWFVYWHFPYFPAGIVKMSERIKVYINGLNILNICPSQTAQSLMNETCLCAPLFFVPSVCRDAFVIYLSSLSNSNAS